MPFHAKGNGVYVHLFHGREDPEKDMGDIGWGSNGPLIGPFMGVHTTYRNEIKGIIDGEAVWTASIAPMEDMIYFRGKWYGDWTILGHEEAKVLVLDETPHCSPATLTPEERHEACSRCGESFAGRGAIVRNPRTGESMHEGCRVIEFGKNPDTSPLQNLHRAAGAFLKAVEDFSSDISNEPDWSRAERDALRKALEKCWTPDKEEDGKTVFEKENTCPACWCPKPCDCDD